MVPSATSRRAATVTPLSTPAVTSVGEGTLRFPYSASELRTLVKSALDEDGAFNDITTIATVVSDRHARGRLVARQPGVLAGIALALEAFRMLDPKVTMRVDKEDGSRLKPGDSVLYLSGHARALLAAERVALNFMQRLSGVASITARYVDAVKGDPCKRSWTRARPRQVGGSSRSTLSAPVGARTIGSISPRPVLKSRTTISPPSMVTSRWPCAARAISHPPARRWKWSATGSSRYKAAASTARRGHHPARQHVDSRDGGVCAARGWTCDHGSVGRSEPQHGARDCRDGGRLDFRWCTDALSACTRSRPGLRVMFEIVVRRR